MTLGVISTEKSSLNASKRAVSQVDGVKVSSQDRFDVVRQPTR